MGNGSRHYPIRHNHQHYDIPYFGSSPDSNAQFVRWVTTSKLFWKWSSIREDWGLHTAHTHRNLRGPLLLARGASEKTIAILFKLLGSIDFLGTRPSRPYGRLRKACYPRVIDLAGEKDASTSPALAVERLWGPSLDEGVGSRSLAGNQGASEMLRAPFPSRDEVRLKSLPSLVRLSEVDIVEGYTYESASSRRPVGTQAVDITSHSGPARVRSRCSTGPPRASCNLQWMHILITTTSYKTSKNLNSKRLDCPLSWKITSHVPLNVISKSRGQGLGV